MELGLKPLGGPSLPGVTPACATRPFSVCSARHHLSFKQARSSEPARPETQPQASGETSREIRPGVRDAGSLGLLPVSLCSLPHASLRQGRSQVDV